LRQDGQYYRLLLLCRREFGLPYLSYGRVLRPPKVSGKLPVVTSESTRPFMVLAVQGSAWEAPDRSVGIFFLNYADEPQEFTWSADLAEAVGWKDGKNVRLSQWTEKGGLKPLGVVSGGKLSKRTQVDARGLTALKLEVEQ